MSVLKKFKEKAEKLSELFSAMQEYRYLSWFLKIAKVVDEIKDSEKVQILRFFEENFWRSDEMDLVETGRFLKSIIDKITMNKLKL